MTYIIIHNNPPQQLYHFGVKGMKWGVIKTDKLTPQTKNDKREEKAKKFDERAKTAKSDKKRKMYELEAERARTGKLSRRQRQVLIGASIVAAYATYKVVDSGEATRIINNGKSVLSKKKANDWNRDFSLADKSLTPEEIMSKVVSRINDDYGKIGTTMNCRRCTFAYAMSRKGYDVSATKSISGTGQTGVDLYNAISDKGKLKGGKLGVYAEIYKDTHLRDDTSDFIDFLWGNKKDAKIEIDIDKTSSAIEKAESIFKALSKMPDGAIGETELSWDIGGTHSVAWEIIKGKPVIIDAQTRTLYDRVDSLTKLTERVKSAEYTRLDNLDLDPVMMGRWLQNAVKK